MIQLICDRNCTEEGHGQNESENCATCSPDVCVKRFVQNMKLLGLLFIRIAALFLTNKTFARLARLSRGKVS